VAAKCVLNPGMLIKRQSSNRLRARGPGEDRKGLKNSRTPRHQRPLCSCFQGLQALKNINKGGLEGLRAP